MPSSVYQNVVNLLMGFHIYRRPIIFMNIAIRAHCLTMRFLDVAKFTALVPLLLLISSK
jgi:hypothetical protein